MVHYTSEYDTYQHNVSNSADMKHPRYYNILPDIFNPSCLKLIPFPLLLLNSLFLTVLATPDEYRSEYKIPRPSCRLFRIRTFSKACREKSTCSAVEEGNMHM